MKVLDICLKRPSIIPLYVLITLVFLIMKFLKCLRVMEDVDMGRLQPATLTLTNRGFYHSSYDCRGGYRSKETSHSFSQNLGVFNFGVDGRCVTRYQ